jgi:hypothetical protein
MREMVSKRGKLSGRSALYSASRWMPAALAVSVILEANDRGLLAEARGDHRPRHAALKDGKRAGSICTVMWTLFASWPGISTVTLWTGALADRAGVRKLLVQASPSSAARRA